MPAPGERKPDQNRKNQAKNTFQRGIPRSFMPCSSQGIMKIQLDLLVPGIGD
jgi:hypothetical protein